MKTRAVIKASATRLELPALIVNAMLNGERKVGLFGGGGGGRGC